MLWHICGLDCASDGCVSCWACFSLIWVSLMMLRSNLTLVWLWYVFSLFVCMVSFVSCRLVFNSAGYWCVSRVPFLISDLCWLLCGLHACEGCVLCLLDLFGFHDVFDWLELCVVCLLDSLNSCVSVLPFMESYCVLLTRVEFRVALMWCLICVVLMWCLICVY